METKKAGKGNGNADGVKQRKGSLGVRKVGREGFVEEVTFE